MTTLPNIPVEVFARRPLLKAVQDYAHARVVSADAALWSFLASVSAFIPAHVSIATGIGAPLKPGLFVVLAGASGTGKSVAFRVARELTPDQPPELPLSTGQGAIESYYGTVTESVTDPAKPDAPAKQITVRKRVRNSVMFAMDEGEALFKSLDRDASVTGETLRSMWSGSTAGQANATAESRRVLEAGTYCCGLVIGLQPRISGRLLRDTSTGTAQRFVWASATDQHIPEASSWVWTPPPIWSPPPGLEAALPSVDELMAQALGAPPLPDPDPAYITLVPEVRAEIDAQQRRVRRGQEVPDEQDSQRTALRLKVAAVLAWIDARLAIDADDWSIAGELLAASDEVRAALLEQAETAEAEDLHDRGLDRAAVRRAEEGAAGLRERTQQAVLAAVVDRAGPDGTAALRDVRGSLSKPQRRLLAEVLEELVTSKAITVDGGPQGSRRLRVRPKGEGT